MADGIGNLNALCFIWDGVGWLPVVTEFLEDAGTYFSDRRKRLPEKQYDEAGRRTEVTDALGNVTGFGYDAAGNQISMTDAEGRTVNSEYDVLNRRVRTAYSDGSFTETEYSECCGQGGYWVGPR